MWELVAQSELIIIGDFKKNVCVIYNIFYNKPMSEGEDTFELLISTEDYLKLQARCEELEKLQEKQKKQYRELSTKIYDIKEEKEQLSLKNIALDAEVTKLNQANN